MNKELTNEERIIEVCEDLKQAMLADLNAKLKEEEVAREKTKTHYKLIKARERLYSIDYEIPTTISNITR